MSRELYEFAAGITDVPRHEAEACGWFDCAEIGGWLRPVTEDEVRWPGGREQAIERMLVIRDKAWRDAFDGPPAVDSFNRRRYFAALLDAAAGGDR